MFAVYSYIAPTVTEVGGLSESVAPVFLLAFGLGMVAGTWLAGRLADWSVMRSLFIGGARHRACCCSSSACWRRPAGGRCRCVF